MKLIRNLALCIFNLSFVLAAQAVPSWATLNTAGYTSSSDAASKYTAYLMAASDAEDNFDGSNVKAIENYFAESGNFTIEVPGEATALTNPYYFDGQYTLDSYVGSAYSTADYVAIVFYGEEAYRVFGAGSAELVNGRLIFDDTSASVGKVGSWQTVPEPTSGLLLIFGLAGLALKRKVG